MDIRKTNLLDSTFTIKEYIEKKINLESDTKIASDLFVCKKTFERWKTKVGVTRYQVNEKRYSIINKMLKNGYHLDEIANKLQISSRNCRYIINKFMVKNNSIDEQ